MNGIHCRKELSIRSRVRSMKKRKKKYTKKKRVIVLRIKIVLFCVLAVSSILGFFMRDTVVKLWKNSPDAQETTAAEGDSSEGAAQSEDWKAPVEEGDSEADETKSAAQIEENSIYTFLQGPRAWNSQAPWSGEWCQEMLAGNRFSVFGCGLCDLANIYSTLSPYECSPVDMFYFAQEVSAYAPGPGYGAIDWPYLEETLYAAGITCEIRDKDPYYEDFCAAIESGVCAITLVSSSNDAAYWQDTEGHYVNIWSYDRETDTVFLADSGDPSHNRQRIPLKYVYDALKTSGQHQYLLVYSYQEEENSWKHSGIEENWTIPEYYISKS